MLFAKDKSIGAPMISINAVADLPAEVREWIYFLRFEDLMTHPAACMGHIFQWLGLSAFDMDLEHLSQGAAESDSHYRMKYLHTLHEQLKVPGMHSIPERIQAQIEGAYAWYYQTYYPNWKSRTIGQVS